LYYFITIKVTDSRGAWNTLKSSVYISLTDVSTIFGPNAASTANLPGSSTATDYANIAEEMLAK